MDINDSTHKLSLDLIGELAFGLELDTIGNNNNEISQGLLRGAVINFHFSLSFIFFQEFMHGWKVFFSFSFTQFTGR